MLVFPVKVNEIFQQLYEYIEMSYKNVLILGPNEEPARSSASHPLPHIQQLLANLHHTLGSAHPLVQPLPEEEEEPDVLNPSSLMANSFVLGKGKAENLEFDWMITEWSTCSQACGGNGFQVSF